MSIPVRIVATVPVTWKNRILIITIVILPAIVTVTVNVIAIVNLQDNGTIVPLSQVIRLTEVIITTMCALARVE